MSTELARRGRTGISHLPKFNLTLTSLSLPDGMTQEDWKKGGEDLSVIARADKWWWADWCREGAERYGITLIAAAEMAVEMLEQELELQTVQNWIGIARAFPPEKRLPGLSMYHYEQTLRLPVEERHKWLQEALDEGISGTELRRRILAHVSGTAVQGRPLTSPSPEALRKPVGAATPIPGIDAPKMPAKATEEATDAKAEDVAEGMGVGVSASGAGRASALYRFVEPPSGAAYYVEDAEDKEERGEVVSYPASVKLSFDASKALCALVQAYNLEHALEPLNYERLVESLIIEAAALIAKKPAPADAPPAVAEELGDFMKRGWEENPVAGTDKKVKVLTDAQKAEIRSRYAKGGLTVRQLAAEYGVGKSTIGDTVKGGVR